VQTRGFGWRIHCGVEVTVLSTNKQGTAVTNNNTLSSRKTSSSTTTLSL
jgi:hypothetical protein